MIDLDPSYGLSLRVLPLNRYLDRVKGGKTIDRLIKRTYEVEDIDDYRDYVVQYRHNSGSIFNLIISTEKLSEVIDTIWYGSEAGREFLLREIIDKLGILEDWDLIILDTIPFYEPKYSILTYMVSDLCIVPLRPTTIDVVRTINMLNTLKRKLRRMIRSEEELMRRFAIVFNMVYTGRRSERRIPDYKMRLLNEISQHLYIFRNYIPDREAFKRINTPEEVNRDLNTIQESFKRAYKEIIELVSGNE